MVERFRIPAPPRLPVVATVAVAAGLPLVMFSLQWAFRPLFEGVPFILFLLAVALSAWAGGLASGLVTVAVSATLGYAFLRGSGDATVVASAHVGAGSSSRPRS